MMKRRLFSYLILIFSLYLLFSLGRQVFETWQKQGQVGEAGKEVTQLKMKNEELKKEIEEQKSEEALEREVREKLGMTKPEETVVVLDKEQVLKIMQGEKEETVEILPVWKQWIRLLLGS